MLKIKNQFRKADNKKNSNIDLPRINHGLVRGLIIWKNLFVFFFIWWDCGTIREMF
jgi:hypothetical protein